MSHEQQPLPPDNASGTQPVPSYLVTAILATVLCCLPLGIVAITYSLQVGSKLSEGDHEGAARVSEKARRWIAITFVAGIVTAFMFMAIQILLSLI